MDFRVETDRLVLDLLRKGDEKRVFLWASDPRATRYMAFKRHESMETVRQFVEGASTPATSDASLLDFVIAIREKKSGLLIGTTGIHQRTIASVDTGYILHPDIWRQGYGSEAVGAVVGWVFTNMPAVEQVDARIFADNVASQALARKIGMQLACEEIVDTPRGDKGIRQLVFSVQRTDWMASRH